MAEKKPWGRPPKYRKWMDDKVIEMGKEGKSRLQMACALDIVDRTFYEWCDPKSPKYRKSFAQAVELADKYNQDYWENVVKNGALNKQEVNASVLGLLMRNKFGYDAKKQVEHTGKGGGPINMTFSWADDDDDESTD